MDYCISDEANNWDNWDLDIFQEDDWEDLNPFEEDMMEANNTDISWADLYWDDNTCWDDTCCDVLETTIDCGPGYHGYYLHHQWDIWDCQMTAHVDTGYCSESDSSKSEPNEPKWNQNIDADEDPNFKGPYFGYGY